MKYFQLQSVLDYRQVLVDRAQQELAEVQKQEKELLDEIELEKTAIQDLSTELESHKKQGINSQELLLYESCIRGKINFLNQYKKRLQEVRNDLLNKREKLLEASKEKKVLEKLKERRMEDHNQEVKRQETLMLNEIATVLFLKRGKDGLC